MDPKPRVGGGGGSDQRPKTKVTIINLMVEVSDVPVATLDGFSRL